MLTLFYIIKLGLQVMDEPCSFKINQRMVIFLLQVCKILKSLYLSQFLRFQLNILAPNLSFLREAIQTKNVTKRWV